MARNFYFAVIIGWETNLALQRRLENSNAVLMDFSLCADRLKSSRGNDPKSKSRRYT